MPFISSNDCTSLYYKDWGSGEPVVFVPGWCLSADMWEYQMVPLAEAGFRCISYDVRGCGRSDQPGGGYDLDTLADDLAAVVEASDCAMRHSSDTPPGAPRSSAISPATVRLGSPGSRS